MRILLISIGTRGDVEPFLAVGIMLQQQGHEVHTAFPEQYLYLAEEAGLQCIGLNKAFLELIEGDRAKQIMGGNLGPIKKIQAYFQMYKESTQVNRILFTEQHTLIQRLNPDRIVYSGKAVYPITWSLNNMSKTILLSPVPCLIHSVKHMPHLGFHKNLGIFNKFTYKLANWGLISSVYSVSKVFPETKSISKKQLAGLIKRNKMVYAVSPQLFPKPLYWPNYVQVMGYQEREKKLEYLPEREIEQFIARHNKLLFVSFGSMENPNPKEKTAIILKTLRDLGIPAIINSAEGGLVEPEHYDQEQFYFVNRIPYDWVLPKIYAVMHHGGSGTTHLAVKYGCASLIIPHIIDQFHWNNIIHDKGLGPKGIAMHKLTRSKLAPKLKALWTQKVFKERAQQVGALMKKEDYSADLIQYIVGN